MRSDRVRYHAEIVLDHQYGAVGGDCLDQGADALDVLVPHPGHRLIKQQHFRVERQGGRYLERALAAVRQLDRRPMRERSQADVADERHRPLVEAIKHAFRTPEVERGSTLALQGHADVFEHGEVRKDGGNLKRTNEAQPCDIGRLHRGDVVSLVGDATARRPQKLGEQIETGCLAGAVRSDQRMNCAARDAQTDAAHRNETGKLLRELFGFENEIVTQD